VLPSAHFTQDGGATHCVGSVQLALVGQSPGKSAVHCPATQSTAGHNELPSLQTRQGTSGMAQSAGVRHPVPAPHSSGAQLQLVGSAQADSLVAEMPE
jgi:hypothetical protein